MSATANDVVSKLISLIEGAAGDAISATAKGRLELVGKLVGGLGDEFAPMLASKYDTGALFDAIVKLEDAMISMEEAGHELAQIFEGKKAAPEQASSSTTTTSTTTTTAPAASSTSSVEDKSKEEATKSPF